VLLQQLDEVQQEHQRKHQTISPQIIISRCHHQQIRSQLERCAQLCCRIWCLSIG
jgi:hypothetical protein